MATRTYRVDDAVLERFDRTAEALGLTSNAAINVFIRKFSEVGGFPFSVTTSPAVDFGDPQIMRTRPSGRGTVIAPAEWRDEDDDDDEW